MPGASGEVRYVKLGRRKIWSSVGLATHWAVAVGRKKTWTWYEIELPDGGKGSKGTEVVKNTGRTSKSGAGYFGGEIVGKTTKTDAQIEDFIAGYQRSNPDYDLWSTNCQQFAVQLIRDLTEEIYRLKHLPDAAENGRSVLGKRITVAHNGQSFASGHVAKIDVTAGPLSVEGTFLSAEYEAISAISGHGFGAWADTELVKLEADLGPLAGAHVGLNANTGAGVRGGNLDVHLLGFGGKIGADGVAIDTPIGGVHACSIM